jgi:hypothetical protein
VLPLGHLSVAYLCYLGLTIPTRGRLPDRWQLAWVAVGSQFPDLVDKPLAYIGVLTYGRSLAHSLLTFTFLTVLLWWGIRRLRSHQQPITPTARALQVLPAPFSIAYASHLLGDSYEALLAGDFSAARFLLYPLYGVPTSPADEIAPWIRLLNIYRDMETHPHLEVILLAAVVFVVFRLRVHAKGRQI